MSVYNESKNEIRESIESILQQTFNNFEFIIINDNPQREDLCLLLNYYEKNDGRVVVINNEQNMGLALSLNKAASVARADVFARMDADDISKPNRFALQYEVISNGSYDVVFSNYDYIDESSITLSMENTYVQYSPTDIRRVLPYTSIIHHPTVMMTKEIFERVGGYRNFPCAQDRDLWLRIWEKGGRFCMINEKLLSYRIRANSISVSRKYQQKLTVDYIQDLFLQRLEDGKDSYSLDNYSKYLNDNGVNNANRIDEIHKYTRILSTAQRVKKEKRYIMNIILRAVVFICSPNYRKSYIKRFKTKLALHAYRKEMVDK